MLPRVLEWWLENLQPTNKTVTRSGSAYKTSRYLEIISLTELNSCEKVVTKVIAFWVCRKGFVLVLFFDLFLFFHHGGQTNCSIYMPLFIAMFCKSSYDNLTFMKERVCIRAVALCSNIFPHWQGLDSKEFPAHSFTKGTGMDNMNVQITGKGNIQKVMTNWVALKTEFQIQVVVFHIYDEEHQVPSWIIPHQNQIIDVFAIPSDGTSRGVGYWRRDILPQPPHVQVSQGGWKCSPHWCHSTLQVIGPIKNKIVRRCMRGVSKMAT